MAAFFPIFSGAAAGLRDGLAAAAGVVDLDAELDRHRLEAEGLGVVRQPVRRGVVTLRVLNVEQHDVVLWYAVVRQDVVARARQVLAAIRPPVDERELVDRGDRLREHLGHDPTERVEFRSRRRVREHVRPNQRFVTEVIGLEDLRILAQHKQNPVRRSLARDYKVLESVTQTLEHPQQ